MKDYEVNIEKLCAKYREFYKKSPMYWILRSEGDAVFFLEKGKIMSLCFEMGDIKKTLPLSKKSFKALKGMAMGSKQTNYGTVCGEKQTYPYNLPQKVERKFEMTEEIFE